MKLNDPFGRLSARHERDYKAICNSLHNAGVKDPQQANAMKNRVRKRGQRMLVAAAISTLLLWLAFPEARLITLPIAGLLVLWLINATRNGQAYIERYIDEELNVPTVGEDRNKETP